MFQFGQIDIKAVGEDVVVTIALDSVMAKKLAIDKQKLLETGIVSTVHSVLTRNKLLVQVGGLVADPMLLNALVNIIGKSALTILYRMLTKRSWTFMSVGQRWLIVELAEMVFNKLLNTFGSSPSNSSKTRRHI